MATLVEPAPQTADNLFLASLEPDVTARLVAISEPMDGKSGEIIAHSREPIKHVLFPLSGAISLVTRMRDGTDVESMLVGREGFFGLPVALGNHPSPNEVNVQVPGTFLRIPSIEFVRLMHEEPTLGARILSWTQTTIEMMAQFSACNRLHAINERGARWLLMAHDRVSADTVHITHEFLATMLGVRRPGVSIATGILDQAGYIESLRGRIVIRDRVGLSTAACECYGTVNTSIERVMGYRIRKS